MMKVFLWRPTWAHFHLELLWQFATEDRIWVETLNNPVQTAPARIPATFEIPAKNPWTSLVFQFLKIGPSSRVGLAETVQSTHWKKIPNPRNDSSIFHSSPVQEQSNPTKSSKNPQQIKCFSQKTLDSILEKFQSKLACFSEISAEKKLDSPGWLKGWLKYSELFADSTCQLECRSSTGLVNILIAFELS